MKGREERGETKQESMVQQQRVVEVILYRGSRDALYTSERHKRAKGLRVNAGGETHENT